MQHERGQGQGRGQRTDAGPPLRVVCFWVRGRQFGVPIIQVKEALRIRPLTPVFLVPSWVAGIINLRGDVVSVIDLGAFLGLGPTSVEESTRILVANVEGRTGGLLADRVTEVRTLGAGDVQPAETVGAAEEDGLVAGLVTLEEGEPLTVLDLAALFESERLRRFSRRGGSD